MSGLEQQVERHLNQRPKVGPGVFIAPGAVVLGDVTLGEGSSVWYNAVLRGDINRIEIGHHSNVQDNAVLHLADDYPCLLGNYVTVGHGAIVHACTIGNEVLVGMGATILDGAVVGDQTVVGAGSLITQRKKIPAGSLVMGSPAKVVRALTTEEREAIKVSAKKYVQLAEYYLKQKLHSAGPLA